MFTATIVWSAQNASNAEVTVLNPDNSEEQAFASGSSGTQSAPWITPNKSYRFTLWDTGNNQKKQLAQTWVSGSGFNCAVPGNTQYYPIPPSGAGNYGTINISSNQAYCVGQTPMYFVNAGSAINQTAQWTSWFNGSVNSQLTISMDGNGYFSGSGNTWTAGDIGHWKKQVSFAGGSQSIEFNVRNCGNNSNTANTNYTNHMTSNSSGNNFLYPCINTPCTQTNNNTNNFSYPYVNAPGMQTNTNSNINYNQTYNNNTYNPALLP